MSSLATMYSFARKCGLHTVLTEEQFEIELALMSTKYRWSLHKEIQEDLGPEEMEITDQERADLIRHENMATIYFKHSPLTYKSFSIF